MFAAAAVKRSFKVLDVTTAMVRALFLKFLAEHFFGAEWETPDVEEFLKFSRAEKLGQFETAQPW